MATKFSPDDLSGAQNNPENYKWGIFYFNQTDTRIILPVQQVISSEFALPPDQNQA